MVNGVPGPIAYISPPSTQYIIKLNIKLVTSFKTHNHENFSHFIPAFHATATMSGL